MHASFKVICTLTSGEIREIQPCIAATQDSITVTIPKALLCQTRCEVVRIESDLFNKTDGQIAASVEAIKAAYDEFEQLKHLQYEFMENHEKLEEGVYRVTYSDGTVITVDYNKEAYTVEKA